MIDREEEYQRLCRAWHNLRCHGRLFITLETATLLFRAASYGLLTSRPAPQPDPRQTVLDLTGGKSNATVRIFTT